jgi:hypothetical protein
VKTLVTGSGKMQSNQSRAARAELFTMRLWQEVLNGGRTEWRGKIQHVGSGQARYFHDWATMVKIITEMLTSLKGEGRKLDHEQ